NGQGLRQFALRDASQNLIELKSVYCPNGVRRVNLDIDVPIGTNLQLVGLGDIQLYRTNNANYLNYPYTINGVCSITGSSVNDEPTSYYYYFYNWEVETQACESAYAKMEITTEDCHSSISENSISSIKVFPNPAYNEIQLLGLDNNSIISISDVNGRILLKNLNYINEKINIEHLPSGIYFINISNEKFSHNQKFIKL
ncbi:MAG: T9SS type A sorting domain-containing protein, partial [Bacteroidales bacterium]|nr:T9SS type A sorting domain-containing protein [Bacteroidales bacterium]